MIDILFKVVILVNNLLFDFFGLLCFVDICFEYIMLVVDVLFECVVLVVVQVKDFVMFVSWNIVVIVLEEVIELLGCVWGIVSYLSVVVDMLELCEVYVVNLLCVIEFWLGLGQDLELFEKYKVIVDSVEYVMLLFVCKKLFENELCGFCLGGVELFED